MGYTTGRELHPALKIVIQLRTIIIFDIISVNKKFFLVYPNTIICKQVNTGYFLISFCLGNSAVHPHDDGHVLPARLHRSLFFGPGRARNADSGAARRHRWHRPFHRCFRLQLGPVCNALPRTYGPGHGNSDHARHEVLPLGEVRSPDGWIPVRVRWRPARYPGYGWRLTTVYPYRPRQLNHARRVAIRPRHGTIEAALSPGRLLSFRKGIAAVFSGIRLGFTAALFFAIIRRSSFRDCPS